MPGFLENAGGEVGMSYYITWWKEGMEMPARLGPMTFEDRGDAERVAAGLNKNLRMKMMQGSFPG